MAVNSNISICKSQTMGSCRNDQVARRETINDGNDSVDKGESRSQGMSLPLSLATFHLYFFVWFWNVPQPPFCFWETAPPLPPVPRFAWFWNVHLFSAIISQIIFWLGRMFDGNFIYVLKISYYSINCCPLRLNLKISTWSVRSQKSCLVDGHW